MEECQVLFVIGKMESDLQQTHNPEKWHHECPCPTPATRYGIQKTPNFLNLFFICKVKQQ